MPITSERVSVTSIKVSIVEDQPDICEYLTFLISDAEGFRCTGTFGSMEEAIDGIGRDRPDVLLLDIGLPGMNGIDGVRILKERYPELLILMNTVYDDDELEFKALCAGASGYLLKKISAAKLLERIRETVAGAVSLSPEVASRALARFRAIGTTGNVDGRLTESESKMLELLVEGYNYKAVASRLGVSIDAVNAQVRSICKKLRVCSHSPK